MLSIVSQDWLSLDLSNKISLVGLVLICFGCIIALYHLLKPKPEPKPFPRIPHVGVELSDLPPVGVALKDLNGFPASGCTAVGRTTSSLDLSTEPDIVASDPDAQKRFSDLVWIEGYQRLQASGKWVKVGGYYRHKGKHQEHHGAPRREGF